MVNFKIQSLDLKTIEAGSLMEQEEEWTWFRGPEHDSVTDETLISVLRWGNECRDDNLGDKREGCFS